MRRMSPILHILLMVMLLAACSSKGEQAEQFAPATEEEINYAADYGWHIGAVLSEGTTVIQQYAPEYIDILESAGLDIAACNSESIKLRSFAADERQQDGSKIFISIYYCNEDIFGATGVLEDWTPGLFAIADKQRLIEQGIIAGDAT